MRSQFWLNLLQSDPATSSSACLESDRYRRLTSPFYCLEWHGTRSLHPSMFGNFCDFSSSLRWSVGMKSLLGCIGTKGLSVASGLSFLFVPTESYFDPTSDCRNPCSDANAWTVWIWLLGQCSGTQGSLGSHEASLSSVCASLFALRFDWFYAPSIHLFCLSERCLGTWIMSSSETRILVPLGTISLGCFCLNDSSGVKGLFCSHQSCCTIFVH